MNLGPLDYVYSNSATFWCGRAVRGQDWESMPNQHARRALTAGGLDISSSVCDRLHKRLPPYSRGIGSIF